MKKILIIIFSLLNSSLIFCMQQNPDAHKQKMQAMMSKHMNEMQEMMNKHENEMKKMMEKHKKECMAMMQKIESAEPNPQEESEHQKHHTSKNRLK